MGFTKWDSESGTMLPGSIKRASSSGLKVWGEKTDTKLVYGTFCAVNPDGGVTTIKSVNDVVYGMVVRDIYADKAPDDRTANIGFFTHGDGVVAQGVDDLTFKRGDRIYVIASGENAGKVTNKASANTLDFGYLAEAVSNNCVAITLGYQVGTSTGTTKTGDK